MLSFVRFTLPRRRQRSAHETSFLCQLTSWRERPILILYMIMTLDFLSYCSSAGYFPSMLAKEVDHLFVGQCLPDHDGRRLLCGCLVLLSSDTVS